MYAFVHNNLIRVPRRVEVVGVVVGGLGRVQNGTASCRLGPEQVRVVIPERLKHHRAVHVAPMVQAPRRSVASLRFAYQDVEHGNALDDDLLVRVDVDLDHRLPKDEDVQEQLRVDLGVFTRVKRTCKEAIQPLRPVPLQKIATYRYGARHRHLPRELCLHRVNRVARDVERDPLVPHVFDRHPEHLQVRAVDLCRALPHLATVG